MRNEAPERVTSNEGMTCGEVTSAVTLEAVSPCRALAAGRNDLAPRLLDGTAEGFGVVRETAVGLTREPPETTCTILAGTTSETDRGGAVIDDAARRAYGVATEWVIRPLPEFPE